MIADSRAWSTPRRHGPPMEASITKEPPPTHRFSCSSERGPQQSFLLLHFELQCQPRA